MDSMYSMDSVASMGSMVIGDEKVENQKKKKKKSKSCWDDFGLHGYLLGPWKWLFSTTKNYLKKGFQNVAPTISGDQIVVY